MNKKISKTVKFERVGIQFLSNRFELKLLKRLIFPSSIFLSEYTKIITASDVTDQSLGVQVAFPHFQEDLITKLLDETLSILKNLSLIYNLESDIFIVGDLHGNIRDLIRIIRKINFFESEAKILFLGDYVDRGDFSIEVITLLFSLICQYPNRIFLLRGNHEFSDVNMNYGFKEQINNLYKGEGLWLKFNTVFSYLPLAAIVDKSIFCVHGGISRHLKSIHQIENFQRPILTFQDNNLLADLMWSDPSTSVSYFLESDRGFGCVFGQDAIFEFIRNHKMERLIRAHQCVKSGIENVLHGKVTTIFSCSNYCNTCKNLAGYVYLNRNVFNQLQLQPLEILKRERARFIECLRKSEDDCLESVEILHSQNLNLIGNSLNTGFKPSNRKFLPVKRKSSFNQPLTRALPIPLVAIKLSANDHSSNRRSCSSFVRSNQIFGSSKDEASDHEISIDNNMQNSMIFSTVKPKVSSLPKVEGKSNIPPLPPIGEKTIIEEGEKF